MMQGMNPTVRSVVVAVVLGVGLIAGLVYLSPSRSPSGLTLETSAAAGPVGRAGGLRTGTPQALDSIGGSPSSLSALLIVLATSAVFSTAFLLFSRRGM